MAVTQSTSETILVRQTRHTDRAIEENLQDLYRLLRILEQELEATKERITELESV